MRKYIGAAAIALVALLTVVGPAAAATGSYTTGLESPPFTTGTVNNQDGWHSLFVPPWLPNGYDQEVVNSGAYGGQVPPATQDPVLGLTFGAQSLRLSNWVTEATGEFQGQTYSASTPNAAGENEDNTVFDGTFQFIPTSADFQDGLQINVSPDNGTGGRMSFVSLTDTDVGGPNGDGGIEIKFYDPVNGSHTVGTYDRTKVHTIRFLIEFKPGEADMVRLFVDGVDIGQRDGICFTTWETFYGSSIPVTNSFEFRADNSVNANGALDCDLNGAIRIPGGNSCVVEALDPSTGPHGYLFDNVTTITRNTDPPAACGAVITGGQILPTGTTCQAYDAGTTNPLGTVQYTVKSGKINSVAPGVFFYYGTISGTEGQTFTIDQMDNGSTPFIPVQHGQVILYDANCNVVKWTPDSDTGGVVTGTLPSTGSFIISVKYSAAALKGENDPGTVTYTIDGATVTLAKK